jgi:hypothetical protein
MTNQRHVILFRAHKDDAITQHALSRLRASVKNMQIIVVSFLDEMHASHDGIFAHGYATSLSSLADLPYGKKLSDYQWRIRNKTEDAGYGANDLPVLQFFRDHRDFDYYWIVEYDVYFSGLWSDLLCSLDDSSADLLATSVSDYEETPWWVWWPSLEKPKGVYQRQHMLRAFLPFCRVSNKALDLIDKAYVDGTSGHYEAVWPSVCAEHDLVIEDIGGHGKYTPQRRRGKHYSSTIGTPSHFPGSFVYRPSFLLRDVELPDLYGGPWLWHPVKG